MNWNSSILAASAIAILTSCQGVSSGTGETIYYPTVEEMARHESQWGLAPRVVKPRYREAGPGDFAPPASSGAASTEAAAAPAPAPSAPAQPTAPPQPPSIPPSLR
ncbi:MAG: hypothetical protein ACOYMN_00435 [Roseimicrobium sp.]